MVWQSARLYLALALCTCLQFILLTPTMCFAQEAVPKTKIRVVDQSGNPIKDAVVSKNYIWQPDGAERRILDRRKYKVDENGIASWEMPGSAHSLQLYARADGYVSMYANWSREELAREKLPVDFTFQMTPGIEMGGIVVDEDGQPISGAKVDVRYLSEPKQNVGRSRFPISLAEDEVGTAAVTDEEGRWTINNAHNDSTAELVVGVSHSDYLDMPIPRDPRHRKITNLEELKNKTAKFEMSRGVVIKAKVLDAKGNQLERGTIVIGADPLRDPAGGEFEIGTDGKFESPPMPEGEIRVTVVVPNFAPQSRVINVSKNMEPLTFELEPGYLTKILVVDDNGRSIPKARIFIVGWQNTKSLYNMRHPNLRGLGVPAFANEEGLFQWTWAPKDKVTYSIGIPGYLPKENIELAPSDEVHVIQLSATLMLSGSVVDDTTAETIDRFAVIPVDYRKSGNSEIAREQRSGLVSGRNGRFRLQLSPGGSGADTGLEYGFKIEAVNYKPWSSDRFRLGQPVGPQVIQLKPQLWPTVRILHVDGEPAVKANVTIGSRANRISVKGYRRRPVTGGLNVVTDVNGDVQIPPIDEPFTIMVYDNNGFAEENFANSDEVQDIRMRKWASLSGQVFDVNEQPVANLPLIFEGIRVGLDGKRNIQDHTGATTDSDGLFEFPRLPPIRGLVRTLPVGKVNRISIPVMLQPGKSSKVEIGKGIVVRGKIRLRGEPDIKVDHGNTVASILRIAAPPFGWPAGVAELNEFDLQGGRTAYNRLIKRGSTIDPQVYLNSVPNYTAKTNADGSFAINVREPGEYELTISIRAKHIDNPGMFAGNAGSRVLRFQVDGSHQKADLQDLGLIEVPAFQAPKLGTLIDDFEFSVNDKPESLFDFKGSYVLLEFWSPRCEVCMAERPKLITFADNRQSEGVTIISLTADAPSGSHRMSDKSTQWIDGRLPYSVGTTSVSEALGIWSFPRYLVVDPEGRLTYQGSLKGAIEELGKVQK